MLTNSNAPLSSISRERGLLGAFQPSNEPWGKDWTKKVTPDALVPGTLILDPATKLDRELTDADFQDAVNRPALLATHEQYGELMAKIGAPTDKLVCTFVASALPAHNEGTKFGSRTVLVITPEIVDTSRFNDHHELIPYFVFEHARLMSGTLPPLSSNSLTRGYSQDVALRAKTETMEIALYNGKLDEYLAFHDRVYRPKSKDPFVDNNVQLRLEAEKIVEERYKSLSTSIVAAILQKKPSAGEKHAEWLERQKRANYKPAELPRKTIVYTASEASSS